MRSFIVISLALFFALAVSTTVVVIVDVIVNNDPIEP